MVYPTRSGSGDSVCQVGTASYPAPRLRGEAKARPSVGAGVLSSGVFGAMASDAIPAALALVTNAVYAGAVLAKVSVAVCWFWKFSIGVVIRIAANPRAAKGL